MRSISPFFRAWQTARSSLAGYTCYTQKKALQNEEGIQKTMFQLIQ